MDTTPIRYTSPDEDGGRWVGFPFRIGDIVISTRSKSGTTWMQMICALLVFQVPDLPAPLSQLSPWLDWLVMPRDEVIGRLERQRHRRFIKTHTPLDGVPIDPRATYILVARHPLDSAVSLYYQGDNIDRERLGRLTGGPESTTPPGPRMPVRDWLLDWIERDDDPRTELDSLPGVMHHLSDAWSRRQQANVRLIHFDDLSSDLDGEMRRLATYLRIDVPESVWPSLVQSASFSSMRALAQDTAPDQSGVLKDRAAFFRRGVSGAGRGLLTAEELRAYQARVVGLAPSGLLEWLHRDPAF